MEEVALSNWKKNERQAAARLGLLAVNKQPEDGKVWALDVELDDGGRVVLSITSRGSLSIQVYRACLKGKTLYALKGSAIVAPVDVADWAKTLREAARSESASYPCKPLQAGANCQQKQ